jgi:hypothetical protein
MAVKPNSEEAVTSYPEVGDIAGRWHPDSDVDAIRHNENLTIKYYDDWSGDSEDQPRRVSRMAIVGLILSVVAVANLAFGRSGLPGVALFGFPALVLSGVGVSETLFGEKRGRWFALAGAAIGLAGFVWLFVMVVLAPKA